MPPLAETFQYVDMHFPLAGIDISKAVEQQPVVQLPDGTYSKTTRAGTNVRSFDPTNNRSRGAQRAGLSKFVNAKVSGSRLIQEIRLVEGIGYPPPGGVVQASQSGRVVTLVAISNGDLRIVDAGGTGWTAPTNSTGAFNANGIVFSAVNNQKMYFADGSHYLFYDPKLNAVLPWVATAGTLPVDSDGNTPRLICTWRGRTVLSGLLKDGQNWFMSKVSDPTNFDYSPVSPSAIDAVAGNNSQLGLVGDTITGLIPYTDDVLFMGGDHTLWVIRGDPLSGGQIDRVSDAIGMAWGEAWCKDPYGAVYFVSNLCGIYMMNPQTGLTVPQRISQQIEQLLAKVNTGANTIRLIWDDRLQGLHVFVTPTAGVATARHLFWEWRVGAWWTDEFANPYHNPLCCATFDGNTSQDRVALIGSWDGYVRFLNPDAVDDDGTAIASSVVIGPILTKEQDEVILKDMQAIIGTGSGDITYSVHLGSTAEAALASTPVATGIWQAGRNLTSGIRRSAHAIYVKLSASTPWAMEQIRVRLAGTGKIRRRGA